MYEIIIYTDGGCSGNPGPGAWAYVMRYNDRVREDSGFESETTNNKMELRAVIEALSYLSDLRHSFVEDHPAAPAGPRSSPPRWLSSEVRLFTDSQYVKNGVESWIKTWKQKSWKTADRKPVKNRELWMRLDLLVQEIKPTLFWVEGHAGNPDNERCDSLVQEKVKAMRGDSKNWDQRESNPRPTA